MLLTKQADIEANSPEASSSSNPEPPPPFNDNNDAVIDFDDRRGGFEEPPPYFTPYEAEYFEVGYGDVVSHDSHLNTDGEALYRFLLSQSAHAPVFRLHCRGTHVEHRPRCESSSSSFNIGRHSHRHHHNGDHDHRHRHNHTHIDTEHVVDFDFYVDITSHLTPTPLHFSIADSEPAYRGEMTRKIGLPNNLNKVNRKDMKTFTKWKKQRAGRGLPPWISEGEQACLLHPDKSLLHAGPQSQVQRSSKTVRQWADDYCQSQKLLKEFTYEKVVFGWDTIHLTNAIRAHIMQAGVYRGNVEVSFETTASKVFVRPDNAISRMLSNKWLKFLLIITLIYPFIWLYMRLSPSGGGKWEVCGAAYALKRYLPVDASEEPLVSIVGEDVTQHGARVVQTPSGLKKLVGIREGEWFREWEGTIADLVRRRYRSSVPIVSPGRNAGTTEEAMLLDGY